MKSLTGSFTSVRGWAVFLALLFGAGLMVSACGEEEVPAPTTPTPPPPAPPPAPEPEPEPEPPATPTGLMVSGSTASSVTWTWNAVEGALGYAVQVSMDEMFDDTDQTALTTETSFTATPVPPETSAYLRVRAGTGTPEALAAALATGSLEGLLLSDWSTHVTGMTTAVPLAPAPTNLRVKERGSDFIEWEWDAVEGVAGYQSQFSASSTFPEGSVGRANHEGMDNTSRRVGNLDPESSGYLRVRTYSGTVAEPTYGDWTEGHMASTSEPPPAARLSAPTGLEVDERDDDSITLVWDRVRNAGSYLVEQREPDDDWGDASCEGGDNEVEDEECVASGLTAGTDYDFRVSAVPSDTDRYLTSEPSDTVESRTLGTTPRPTTPTTPGGTGDLNVTWKSTADTITFSWEPVAGTEYEWTVLTDFNDDSNPCGGMTFDTPTGMGTSFSHPVASLARGDIRGLCVRIDDDDLDDDERAVSFAWGATTPAAPAVGGATIDQERHRATALNWTGIQVKPGFEWELRLVADSGRNDGDLSGLAINATTMRGTKEVQTACSGGTQVDRGDADIDLTVDYTWDGAISPFTGYLLCLRYANTVASTEWAVPVTGTNIAEIYTPAAAPPSPRYEASQSSTAADGSTKTLVWIVPIRNSFNVPRPATSPGDAFTATIIHYPVRYDHDGDGGTTSLVNTPAPTNCDALTEGPSNLQSSGTNPWDSTTTAATITNDLDGLKVTSAPITRQGNDGQNLGVRLCVRATKDSANNDLDGPWVIGGATTITKRPAS